MGYCSCLIGHRRWAWPKRNKASTSFARNHARSSRHGDGAVTRVG